MLLFVIAVPWPDLSTGTHPDSEPKPPGLKLLASKSDTRAWPGGFGYAKVGGKQLFLFFLFQIALVELLRSNFRFQGIYTNL